MSASSVFQKNTDLVKEIAAELGFISCGISKAEQLDDEARKLEKWLNQGHHGQMLWMENHFEKRINPQKLVEGSKSVISLLLNYYPSETLQGSLKISKYAYGKDYHKVIKKKTKILIERLTEQIGDFQARAFVDSAPVLDKAWAQKSGLGWVGKHSNLLSKKSGSFFFIAEIITDLEFTYDTPVNDHCGTCTKCIDACPTQAITEPYVVDGSKCISYYTIELKDAIPQSEKGRFDNWIFGCDICQDVCPWNRFSKPHNHPEFEPSNDLKAMQDSDWIEITDDVFNKVFPGSAVRRTKIDGLKRNINFVTKN